MGRGKWAIVLAVLVVLAAVAAAYAVGRGKAATNSQAETGKSEPSTQAERFIARRGQLIVKDYYKVGTVIDIAGRSLDVKLLVFSTPGAATQAKVFGFTFTRPGVERYESAEVSYLDFDESTAALEALDFMLKMASQMDKEDHEQTEVLYETRGGMQLGFVQFASRGQTGVARIGGPIGAKYCFMSMANLARLRDLVRNGIGRLQEMGAG